MPKARTRSGSSKNVAASSSASANATPAPLLDGLLEQMHLSAPKTKSTLKSNEKVNVSNVQSSSTWQCNTDDWSDKAMADSGTDTFSPSLRAIERKNERARDKIFRTVPEVINENQEKLISEHDTPRNGSTSATIDLKELSSIVADLISGTRDEAAFGAFLTMLEHFSVRSPRDDHLEETVYHLIQAAVTFIRTHEQRFDLRQLQECYRRRHTHIKQLFDT